MQLKEAERVIKILKKKTPNESSNRGEWGSGAIRGEGGKGSGSVGPYGKNKRNKGEIGRAHV